MNLSDQFAQQLSARLTRSTGSEKAFREAAWAGFQKQGLPTRRHEAWKYTNLAPLERSVWQAPPLRAEIPPEARDLIRELRSDCDVALIVNGELRLSDSALTLEAGYELKRAREFAADYEFSDGLAAAAAAVHQLGYELQVYGQVSRPLVIVHCQAGEGSWCSTFNQILVERAARLELAELFLDGPALALRTQVTIAKLAEGSSLTWVNSQEQALGSSYFSEIQVEMAASSLLSLHPLQAGAGWARANTRVRLCGEGAEAHLNGLSFGRQNQHLDQRIEIQHVVGRTTSSQLYKNVLKDKARGILNGKIHIARHAQKVMSSQLNHNLLLSNTAEADTKPELEIYADDVKANHGASCGRLDEEKLFYLVSRGIPRLEAQRILAKAFVADVLMKITANALRHLLNARLERLLPEFLAEMESSI